jgi:hypothetical protein
VSGRKFTGCQLVGAQDMTGDRVELYPVIGVGDCSRLVCGPDGMESAGV